jgi:cellulose synthase/poly-beta-1,6-N-acetylglucosamine synthase-like glycosyltransferase
MIIFILMLMASLITIYPLGMYLCYYHDEVWVTVITVGDKFRVQEKKK